MSLQELGHFRSQQHGQCQFNNSVCSQYKMLVWDRSKAVRAASAMSRHMDGSQRG